MTKAGLELGVFWWTILYKTAMTSCAPDSRHKLGVSTVATRTVGAWLSKVQHDVTSKPMFKTVRTTLVQTVYACATDIMIDEISNLHSQHAKGLTLTFSYWLSLVSDAGWSQRAC